MRKSGKCPSGIIGDLLKYKTFDQSANLLQDIFVQCHIIILSFSKANNHFTNSADNCFFIKKGLLLYNPKALWFFPIAKK